MEIRTTKHIGQSHTNHCEDEFYTGKLNEHLYVLAVMDGCSAGVEAHFASALLRKILKKTTAGISVEDLSKKEILKEILRQIFEDLRYLQQHLKLDKLELLSTLIIGVVDSKTYSGEFIAIGDGLIYHDGKYVEYNQHNMPDYLAYHLNEDFETWYQGQKQRLSLNSFTDLSLCTDGILAFIDGTTLFGIKNLKAAMDFVVEDTKNWKQENVLQKKVEFLEHQQNIVPYDDLTIVRVRAN